MLPILTRGCHVQSPHEPALAILKPLIDAGVWAEWQRSTEGSTVRKQDMPAAFGSWVLAKRLWVNTRNVISFQRILNRNLPVHVIVWFPSQRFRPVFAKPRLTQLSKI